MTDEVIPIFTSQQLVLIAMNKMGKHIFSGSVPQHIIDKRRARNKMARKSRRANRG